MIKLEKFFQLISEFIHTSVLGCRLIFSTFWESLFFPIWLGGKRFWNVVWNNLIFLTPHYVFSFFYISFAILSAYLEFTPPASPPNSTTTLTSLQIMADLLSVNKEWIVVWFGVSAWLISNIRRPAVYIIACLPLFFYAYAVTWGVVQGLVVMRGLLASLAYLTVGLFAIVTIRQEIQNAIHTHEIKKLHLSIKKTEKKD